MPGFRLGDLTYIRRLSDLLNPRSAKVLPSKVADQDWLPVIPYNTDLSIERIWLTSVQDNSQEFLIQPYRYQVEVGSSQSINNDFPFPPGFVYELQWLEFFYFSNAFPAAGDYLIFDIEWGINQVTFNSPSGGPDVKTNFTSHPFAHRIRNPAPYLLATDSTTYRWAFPNGIYNTRGGNDVAYQSMPKITIVVPTGAEDGMRLQFAVEQYDSSNTFKNYNASASMNTHMVWRRRPIGEYDVKGQRNP